MSNILHFKFGEPIGDCLSVELRSGDTIVSFLDSYLFSSLDKLISALHSLLFADGKQAVIWPTEPIEYEMQFKRMGNLISLEVLEYPDYRRVVDRSQSLLNVSGSYEQIVLPFWRAMRSLEGRYSETEWKESFHRTFPTHDLGKWTAELKHRKILA